ncbi:hypothetical protein SCHPADRAFT_849585 [Schizopora paradoxa]|uniref:DNA helicase n=1 Tax=Schizopora paradoxa TaxID=27342 RepID=A0A0H2RTQ0_9AGAM|nr:hypothetical protein SCHPADRAFT_849585 [Schizopora paradoxa]
MGSEANRTSGLNTLQASWNQRQMYQQHPQMASSSSIASSSSSSSNGPPAQSRDATVSSRYFTPQQPAGRILVPSSSPMGPQSGYRPYQTFSTPSEMMQIPGLMNYQNHSFGGRAYADPLSQPSGFILPTNANNASGSRQQSSSLRRPFDEAGLHDGMRPPKRQNVGPSSPMPTMAVSPGSPPSPDVARPGQRRKRPLNEETHIPSSPNSSEEFPTDPRAMLGGSSRPRIVRGQRSDPDAIDESALTSFVFCYPGDDRRATAAFRKCNGDKNAAAKLMQPGSGFTGDPPPSPPKPSPTEGPKVTGKNKDVVEKREAEKALLKELGAKSAIYKQRRNLEHASESPSATASTSQVIDIPSSPLAPVRSARTKVRKIVVDSDSEGDAEIVSPVKSVSNGTKVLEGNYFERKALESLNTFGMEALRQLTGCSEEQASRIISLRPFASEEDLVKRLNLGKKKAGLAGISPRVFQDCVSIYEGFGAVDEILLGCEEIGSELKTAISAWSGKTKGKQREGSVSAASLFDDEADDGAIDLVSLPFENGTLGSGLISAPSSLSKDVQLKDYQIIGINWLNLLHSRRLSCILADEMGLGKTVQVISFFAHLKEKGIRGPHLIVVPSSTLENWLREFQRFAPKIAVQPYYADKNDRPQLRENLLETRVGGLDQDPWEVLITTYNLAVGDEKDRKFFRRIDWNTCVFDEGHVLKNFQSQRYQALMRFDAKWKLLLTGTPLQNNLQELVSLMNFILPNQFAEHLESLRAIFKVKGDSKVSLLAEERVSRAKRMMTPFVLRRRKDQVLKDLPRKSERIEWCEMTATQKAIYRDVRLRSRKTVLEATDTLNTDANDKQSKGAAKGQKKGRPNARGKEKVYLENSANVLMDLRKAAAHPMLFRTQFTDNTLTSITRLLLKEPDFKKRGAIFEYVKEDMEVMTDAELQHFCKLYKSTQKFLLDGESFLDAGKVKAMLMLLEKYQSEGRRCLIFSQFTQVLDILQVVLKAKDIKYLVLTGSTAVDARQGLVDEFTKDTSIPVFLLSTRAGGMGINLTAASVVILFDQDFNPHNDRQAADRAYRIGQKRDVDIVKLITKGSIEEDMLRLGETKLALDEAVAGDTEESDGKAESAPEKMMKTSLLETLRKQFEEEDKRGEASDPDPAVTGGETRPPSPSPLSSSRSSPPRSTPKAQVKSTKAKTMILDSDSDLTDLDS